MSQPITRRTFLKTAIGSVAGAGVFGIGASAYVTRIEPTRLAITRVSIPLPNLPPAFDGYTLAQISDWHLGEWMTLERMMGIVAEVNALSPDLIVITGDFVSVISQNTQAEITTILRALQARDGVAATLGNHDHWTHAPTVRQAIRDAGTWLMWNTDAAILRGDQSIHLVGVDDIWENEHDLEEALQYVPEDAATILLAHEPDYADEVAATGRIGLQLSGHSHGGQVRIPGKGALILPYLGQNYDSGLYSVEGMHLYVNRGLGMVAPYVRLNCLPEVTHITLTAVS